MDKMQKKSDPVPALVPGGKPVRMHLKPERIQQLLLGVPGWELRGESALVRVRLFATLEGAGVFAFNACWLAVKQRQPVMVGLAGKEVTIALPGHTVRGCTGGITEAVFKLAGMIG